jgi:hypothetical protein
MEIFALFFETVESQGFCGFLFRIFCGRKNNKRKKFHVKQTNIIWEKDERLRVALLFSHIPVKIG